ncbi:MAG: flagellar export chaperone FlgN [Deltaproteobacteria bacterium]|nr:flagellar export chaperone FlgN [Deltaproteobacteria bacterium]
MEITTKDIIDNYSRRLSLFKDLLSCIMRERENLINRDIRGIWSSLEEKQSIVDSIEETTSQLNGIMVKDAVNRDMLERERSKIVELSRSLMRLKQEIRARVSENVSFINETLGFFNEIISAMTMSEADKCASYGPYGNARRGRRCLMYQGRV